MLRKASVALIARGRVSLRLLFTETLASPPPGRARLITSLFIGAYLLWQVAVPLAYYLGRDKSDERFAWRMFSATGLSNMSCTVSVTEWVWSSASNTTAARKLDVERILHRTWNYSLLSNRAAVDQFLRTRCQADPSVTQVHLIRSCLGADRTWIPSAERRLTCSTGAFGGTRGSL